MIDSLIDKQDNFELIRDQIASILATESASQQAMATGDSTPWAFRVYAERFRPEEAFQDGSDLTPIVNVWFDNSTFNPAHSNLSQRQECEAVFNIDCYAFAYSQDTDTGHMIADEQAAKTLHRVIRLVRNILASSEWTFLGLRGIVGHRWIQSITQYQPKHDGQSFVPVIASRIALSVRFNEFAPQYTPTNLEIISLDITRAADGQLLAEADYVYT